MWKQLPLLLAALLAAYVSAAPEFRFYPHDVTPDVVRDVQLALRENSERISTDLLSPALRPIEVHVWAKRHEFMANPAARGAHEIAGTSGYVADAGDHLEIHLLYSGTTLGPRAQHELGHIISLAHNPDASNNPRWLWEVVGLYAAKEFRPPHQLSCVTLSDIPSFTELNDPGSPLIYLVGYLLGEFIVGEFGAAKLVELIKASGDTTTVLELSRFAFTERWHQAISSRYLQHNPIPPILGVAQITREVAGNTFYLPDGRSLYFAANDAVYLKTGGVVHAGHWYVSSGTGVCWQVLNFEAYCASFRMNNNRFFLDTPADCERYPLRRVTGNPEQH